MQITERGTLGPGFERRLRVALDRIVPPTSLLANARYRSMMPARAGRIWRLAPALVGIAAIGIMATSATVATGSTNPAVWTQRAASTIQSVRQVPESKPNAAESTKPEPSHRAPSSQRAGTSRHVPSHSRDTEPSPKPEPSGAPEGSTKPDSSPRPSDDPNLPDSNGPSRDRGPTSSTTSYDRGDDSGGSLASDFAGAQRS